jgi:hypothetical protein
MTHEPHTPAPDQNIRCAECNCEHGGVYCNWISATPGEYIAEINALRAALTAAEGELANGSFYKETDIDTMIARAEAAEAQLAALERVKAEARADVAGLVEAARGMKRIIEGIDGAMNYGTWRSERSNLRIKDTQEWVDLYNALAAWEGRE